MLEHVRRLDARVRQDEAQDVCERCEGARYVRVRLNPDAIPVGVPCSCMPLDEQMAQCGIEARYRGNAFENFEPMDGKRDALTAALEWDCTRSVVLMGPVGTGKTHLAVAMASKALRRMRPVRFVTTSDFLAELKARFGTDQVQPYFDAVANTHTLIIDDLGAEQDTEWAIAQLAQLVNRRYAKQLPTVVTTNLDYAAIKTVLGERTASRMSEWKWIFVGGEDVRHLIGASQ